MFSVTILGNNLYFQYLLPCTAVFYKPSTGQLPIHWERPNPVAA